MKKIIFLVLVVISLFSCKEIALEPKLPKELIDLICAEKIRQKELFESKSKLHIYKNFPNDDVFAKLNNTKFVETDFYELLRIYEKSFKTKFETYNEFMYEVINEDFVLNETDFEEKAFLLDKELNKEIKSLTFDDFLKKYSFKKKNDKKLYLKDELFSGNRFLTISYLLYTKGYYLGSGCLGEGTGIYKFEDLLLIK